MKQLPRRLVKAIIIPTAILLVAPHGITNLLFPKPQLMAETIIKTQKPKKENPFDKKVTPPNGNKVALV